MRTRFIAVFPGVLLLASAPAWAHHAFSGEFDSTKPITLEGVVTRISWENPHVYFYLDVQQPDGVTVNWTCETRGPNGLERRGWKRDSLSLGEHVIVHGYLARNGSHMVDGRDLTLASGKRILTGSNAN